MVSSIKPGKKNRRENKSAIRRSVTIVVVAVIIAVIAGVTAKFLIKNNAPDSSDKAVKTTAHMPTPKTPPVQAVIEELPPPEALPAAEQADNPPLPPVAESDKPEPEGEPEPTEEQYMNYIKTQMFKDEAKESLPLIGMRAFNALEARNDDGEAVSQPDSLRISGRDKRGLKEGEIWVRINAGYSSEFQEIMAQTADIYRSNLEYDGEVTVILWVGGQPRNKRTFTLAGN